MSECLRRPVVMRAGVAMFAVLGCSSPVGPSSAPGDSGRATETDAPGRPEARRPMGDASPPRDAARAPSDVSSDAAADLARSDVAAPDVPPASPESDAAPTVTDGALPRPDARLVGDAAPPAADLAELPADARLVGDAAPPAADLAELPADARAPAAEPLQVRFLGVGGYVLRRGRDVILTAPLFSNPALLTVAFGDIAPDADAVGRLLDPALVRDARAILVGHAHYDHLLDVPIVWPLTDGAIVYGNASTAHILVGGAVPRENLVVLNDPENPLVDRRMCPDPDPCTGIPSGTAGEWVAVPGADVRIRALCSMHAPQILNSIPWALGCVTEDFAELPRRAPDWMDGGTLAYLVDFLEPGTGRPVYRIYYQDAPTDAPYGHVDADILAEKRVDLALLNVGNFDAVRDHPGEIVAHLQPRFLIGGHWEDFFFTQDHAPTPIPFLPDPVEFDRRAGVALAAVPGAEAPAEVNGEPAEGRYWRPWPETDFTFPAAD